MQTPSAAEPEHFEVLIVGAGISGVFRYGIDIESVPNGVCDVGTPERA